MNLLKYIALGAAAAYGISYLTKKRDLDGKSVLDDLTEKAPDWMDTIKKYSEDAINQASKRTHNAADAVQSVS